jgi:hypothetical protein
MRKPCRGRQLGDFIVTVIAMTAYGAPGKRTTMPRTLKYAATAARQKATRYTPKRKTVRATDFAADGSAGGRATAI